MTPLASTALGIIAGGGRLPLLVADAVRRSGGRPHIFAISGEADSAVEAYPHDWLSWGEFGRLFRILREKGCEDVLFAGRVSRPEMDKIKLDAVGMKLMPSLMRLTLGGDDDILSGVVRIFEERGFRVRGVADVAPELLAPEGRMSRRMPGRVDWQDIHRAVTILKVLGRLDIGQAIVVDREHVLGVEAAEGTDALIERCGGLRQWGRRKRTGVLVKILKPGQEQRVDMPTIGPTTVRLAAEAGLAGIAVEARRTILADREETVALADELGVFLLGIAVSRDDEP